MRLPTRQIRKARIEIIPMIDTIFFLLVFFMIASLTMIRMRAISVALPKTSSAASGSAAGAASSNLILTVPNTGGYFLGKQRVGANPNALQSALTTQLQARSTRAVVLNFGKGQTYQTLIGVMDIVNKARAASGQPVPVLIATEPIDQNGRALLPTPPGP